MFSLNRPALLLVLIASSLAFEASCSPAFAFQAPAPSPAPAAPAASDPATPASSSQAEPSAAQTPAEPAAKQPTASSMSVQARIRARREQRRVAAINEVYNHLYEIYIGAGFTRTLAGNGAVAGAGLQHFNLYTWNVGLTRYFNEKLGA